MMVVRVRVAAQHLSADGPVWMMGVRCSHGGEWKLFMYQLRYALAAVSTNSGYRRNGLRLEVEQG